MTRNSNTYNDEELFAQLCQSANRELAFRELYRRYEQRCWAYSRICLHDDERARDVLQETFYRVFKAGERGTVVENVGAYIMRILRNLCIDDQKKNSMDFVNVDDIDVHTPVMNYEQAESTQIIETAIQLLPEEHREALLMQAFGDMSYNEIAAAQNVPLSTVRNRIVRAKAQLRKILSQYLSSGEQS